MLRGHILKLTVFSLAAFILLGGCRKREGFSLADNYIVFTSNAQGISEAETSITIKLKLVRGVDNDIPVVIKITEQGAAYGVKYTTIPAATAGTINLTAPSGNNEASFTINKVPGVLFDGTEKLVFDLYSSGSPLLIGTTKQLTLSFAELVATNSTAVLNGGGPTYPNKVFIDLSANRQTAVLRTNWDLGFYTDASDFKVILNSSNGMTAKQITKNDLTQVTATDTVGFFDAMGSLFGSPAQLPLVDYPSGDMSKTAIGLIAATAADNKVFIIYRGKGVGSPLPERGWKKIRVLRNASGGYTLQHADIASTTFTSIDIPKDDKYFFKYISFETGAVTVEPEKTKWDIAWTHSTYVSGSGASEFPFLFQDVVFQNRNVQVAKMLTSSKAYADFAEADIAGQTFTFLQTAIGSDWRSGGGPSSGPAVKTTQYYIIKDGNNNYYKLKFTAVADGGIRGNPSIEYALVKRG
ncbi:MAG: HmuY family protein [Chitinophagaceae bacterium]